MFSVHDGKQDILGSRAKRFKDVRTFRDRFVDGQEITVEIIYVCGPPHNNNKILTFNSLVGRKGDTWGGSVGDN